MTNDERNPNDELRALTLAPLSKIHCDRDHGTSNLEFGIWSLISYLTFVIRH